MKLALFAALGIAATHAFHLVIARRITGRALAEEQLALGRTVARVVAREAADAVLVHDDIALHELAVHTASGTDIAYCFIARDGRVLASSFSGPTPRALVDLRPAGEDTPLVVVSRSARYLDLAEPVIDAQGVVVRLGLDMRLAAATNRTLAILLGSLALGVIGAGLVAAFVVGRSIARPLGELVRAANRFDPGDHLSPVATHGTDEIAEVTEQFNSMMERLQVAHDEHVHAREAAAAAERMAALGVLVGGVAHEINNPLAGMKNCLRGLERDDLRLDKRQEYLELMDEGLERIEDVVGRLLDFGRPRPLELRDVPMASLAREGASFLRPLLRKRGIAYAEDLGSPLGAEQAVADHRQVGQALLNLILNAIHATPRGGRIRVHLRARGDLLGVAIEDDGAGVPEPIRHRIVEPFFTTKPPGEGTGLGLSVTRAIAEAHGGALGFEFPARGTVAILWLRRAEAPAP
jgi:signal transduction histidine kinase